MNRTYKLAVVAVLLTLMVTMVGATNAQALNGGCGQIHIVQQGENLFRIALRYKVTVAQVQQWNALPNANLIFAGQSLCIQGPVTNPPPSSKVHTVWYGDTLGRIARTYGVDLNVLARVNHIVNVNFIYVGQKLNIPDFTIQ
jgi:spore germination protein